MACEVCEHCQGPAGHNETLTVRDGYSYHEKCHKCYVCSETNLRNAEVFKGVIFCSSCSQRIFQGCSTARKTKNTVRRPREKAHKRRSHRTQDRRSNIHDGILELTTLAVSSDSSSDHQETKTSKIKAVETSVDSTVRVTTENTNEKTKSLKKSSVEIGMTTEVTQELLKQLNCPVVTDCRRLGTENRSSTKRRRKKPECSDLRIAELGTSTEIANMALRNKSELPVIIKSDSRIREMNSLDLSELNQKSDSSDAREEWMDSAYSSLRDSTRTHWMDRRIGSILKLPYKAFKKNILARSSFISVLMSSDSVMWPVCSETKPVLTRTIKKKIKSLFYEEIADHQKRGLKRLYSTINRKKIPHKLGWLDIVVTNNCADCQKLRCKHFKASHSYRCMRAHVMRLAGPTASELAGFRNKVKSMVSPGFINNLGAYNRKHVAVVTSQACGNSVPGSTKL